MKLDDYDETHLKVGSSILTPLRMKLIEELEEECQSIFKKCIVTFEDVCNTDKFMRKFSLFCILVWFVLNITYQLLTLGKSMGMSEYTNAVFVYFEACFIGVFTFSFLIMARPHSKAQVMYGKLCSAMALCPNIPTAKISWLWLLEYYQGTSTRYTLHLFSRSHALSNLNFLRLMSWFVTCMMILAGLWKHRLDLQIWLAEGAL